MKFKSILIVDDSTTARMLVHGYLTSEGFNDVIYHEAEDGSEALKLIATLDQKPDFIITDILMPVLNGYDFIEKVREIDDYKEIPIIILSSMGSHSPDSIQNEPHIYEIHKPTSGKKLMATIRKFM